MELAPGSFRTFVVGTSYQLGNLASSASSTIEAQLGTRFPLPPLHKVVDGKAETVKRYEYGLVVCIFMGCVYAYTILLTFLGPERRGKMFDVAHDSDMAQAAGSETIERALNRNMENRNTDVEERNVIAQNEKA